MGARAIPPTKRSHIKTGTYVGDGNDNRNLDIGVNLANALYAWVIVKSPGVADALHRIEYGQGDNTMYFSAGVDTTNAIQAFTTTGFQLGTDNRVNQSGITFRYITVWENQ
ncbi:MAG: hypothetical protein AMJ79_11855 [Phycisphaerae bacterium SM23_30]|nr:MAG: hypothetical protein AMJ79_11855 [Phycisphaerae bacterium SM23_30]